ncbi:O-antigen/teichoic acid export membrane protein [Microlunatus panaciterrae]|uniref:O-antigen/teichoic acid export membrane protein n=1 Tax=Microlunatus panaciterrae TaxID=400768 RepID=A0ABS2RHR4_9ACTN|nr:O-antigen/teichoic acid export membrane protein [Microlunatus panaciterrae]
MKPARAKLTAGRRGIISILAGTAGGQGVALLAAPLLSRMYDPADFGVLAIISALVAVLGTVAALRFELAVPLPRRENDAYSLVFLGLLSSTVTFLVGTAIVAIGGDFLSSSFGVPQLMPWLWLVPVIAAVMGVYLTLNQLAIRRRRYNAIARRNLAQSVATVLAQLGGGLAGFAPGGLVVGLGIGQLTSAAAMSLGSSLRSPPAREGRTLSRLKQNATRYRKFPLLMMPSGLLNVAGLQVPVVLIAIWYGTDVAGWLGMTQRVLALPVMLVGTAIAQVYLGKISTAIRDDVEDVWRLFKQTSQRLAIVGGLAAVGVAVLGPWLFALVFGAPWHTSGLYAQALALSLALQLVAVPVSQTLIVFENQAVQLGWDFARLVLSTGAVALCWASGWSALVAVWSFGMVSAAAYAGSWLLSRWAIKTRLKTFAL